MGQVVWYAHLLKNIPLFIVIHTIRGFGIVKKAEIDVFLELSCFFDDTEGIGNLISGSLPFLKPAWTSGSSRFTYCWSLAWRILSITLLVCDFPGGSDGKASVYKAGDPGSIPGWGRSPGEGNGNPLQYSCLENPMDRAWWATVHGFAKSRTKVSDFTSLISVWDECNCAVVCAFFGIACLCPNQGLKYLSKENCLSLIQPPPTPTLDYTLIIHKYIHF